MVADRSRLGDLADRRENNKKIKKPERESLRCCKESSLSNKLNWMKKNENNESQTSGVEESKVVNQRCLDLDTKLGFFHGL